MIIWNKQEVELHQAVYERQKDGSYTVCIVSVSDKPSLHISAEDFFYFFPHVSKKTVLGCGEASDEFIDEFFPIEEALLA